MSYPQILGLTQIKSSKNINCMNEWHFLSETDFQGCVTDMLVAMDPSTWCGICQLSQVLPDWITT